MTLAIRTLFLVILLIPASWRQIGEKNRAIREAESAYTSTDFEESVRRHLALINEHQMTEPQVKFNLALSYQNNGQEEDAQRTFTELTASKNRILASFSANQSGVLEGNQSNYKDALSYFKTALLKDPTNEAARYNYELLARWLEDNEDENEEKKDDEQDQMEPSNYAKRMKAQADELVDQFRFNEALETMTRALEIDETVGYYQGFINQLNDIREINEN